MKNSLVSNNLNPLDLISLLKSSNWPFSIFNSLITLVVKKSIYIFLYNFIFKSFFPISKYLSREFLPPLPLDILMATKKETEFHTSMPLTYFRGPPPKVMIAYYYTSSYIPIYSGQKKPGGYVYSTFLPITREM